MKIKYLSLIALVLAVTSIGFAQAKTTHVKIYLVALDDKGKLGKKIGCGDSLVAVTRTIPATSGGLKAAIEELLSFRSEDTDKLQNFWTVGESLTLKSVSIKKGTATINITGEGPTVAGVCDEPRVVEQIEATARQFPSVKRVKVFVNGKPLADVIS